MEPSILAHAQRGKRGEQSKVIKLCRSGSKNSRSRFFVLAAISAVFILGILSLPANNLPVSPWLSDTVYTAVNPVVSAASGHRQGDVSLVSSESGEQLSKNRQEDEWLIFLRIPRTASTFFGQLLSGYPNRFGGGCGWKDCRCQHAIPETSSPYHGNSIPCSQTKCFESCGLEKRRSLTFDAPRADYAEIIDGLRRSNYNVSKAYVFTVLRDPLQRFLSEFRYASKTFCKENGLINAWDYSTPCNISLANFVMEPQVHAKVHNRQTKMVAGVGDKDWADVYSTPQEMLDVAIMNLEKMALILIQEDIASSLRILRTCRDFLQLPVVEERLTPLRSTQQHINLTDEIDPLVRIRILELNDLDTKLYEHGITLFNRMINQVQRHICPMNADKILPRLTVASLMSGSIKSLHTNTSMVSSPDVRFGEDLPAKVVAQNPKCHFQQTPENHIGTFSWYNALFGCAYNYDWYRSGVWELTNGLTFEARIFDLEVEHLYQHEYILIIGAAQTMGIQSLMPFTALVEDAVQLPVISVGWGGVGASFYTRMLHQTNPLSSALRTLIRFAKVVVVQTMSGRSGSTHSCQSLCGNMYCQNGKPVATYLGELSGELKESAERELRADWLSTHTTLFDMIDSARDHNDKSGQLLGTLYISALPISVKPLDMFPQIVGSEELERLERHVLSKRGGFMTRAYQDNHKPDIFPIRSRSLCASHCPPLDTSQNKTCTMESLPSNCDCASLNINYHPSQSLHNLTAQHLVKTILEKCAELNHTKSQASKLHNSGSKKFLIFQTKGNVTLLKRNPIMLLDSLCFHHPDIPIYLFVLNGSAHVDWDVTNAFSQKGCHIKVVPIDLRSFVRGTPVQAWIASHGHSFEAGPYWYSHVTDLFRLTIPWQYGGIYLDTDFIVTRPIAHIRNTLVRESKEFINNAFSVFDARHPFLDFAMRKALHWYDPSIWNSLGPRLITRAFDEWSKSTANEFCPGPKCVHVLDSRAAFPIHYTKANNLFVDASSAEVDLELGKLSESQEVFAIHYSNKLSESKSLAGDSYLKQIYSNNCVLCFDHF